MAFLGNSLDRGGVIVGRSQWREEQNCWWKVPLSWKSDGKRNKHCLQASDIRFSGSGPWNSSFLGRKKSQRNSAGRVRSFHVAYDRTGHLGDLPRATHLLRSCIREPRSLTRTQPSILLIDWGWNLGSFSLRTPTCLQTVFSLLSTASYNSWGLFVQELRSSGLRQYMAYPHSQLNWLCLLTVTLFPPAATIISRTLKASLENQRMIVVGALSL